MDMMNKPVKEISGDAELRFQERARLIDQSKDPLVSTVEGSDERENGFTKVCVSGG